MDENESENENDDYISLGQCWKYIGFGSSGKKVYQCPFGGRKCPNKQVRHMVEHSSECKYNEDNERNNLACPTCKRLFTRRSNLKQHQRVHSGSKECECPICRKGFSWNQSWKVHLKNAHNR